MYELTPVNHLNLLLTNHIEQVRGLIDQLHWVNFNLYDLINNKKLPDTDKANKWLSIHRRDDPEKIIDKLKMIDKQLNDYVSILKQHRAQKNPKRMSAKEFKLLLVKTNQVAVEYLSIGKRLIQEYLRDRRNNFLDVSSPLPDEDIVLDLSPALPSETDLTRRTYHSSAIFRFCSKPACSIMMIPTSAILAIALFAAAALTSSNNQVALVVCGAVATTIFVIAAARYWAAQLEDSRAHTVHSDIAYNSFD